MPTRRCRTTARQLIGWLSEDKVNAGSLSERMRKSVERSKPGPVALRRLFRYDESLDTYKRKRRPTLAEEYFEKHGRENRKPPPKSASELMERQVERDLRREQEYQKAHGWSAIVRGQISEAMDRLDDLGLL